MTLSRQESCGAAALLSLILKLEKRNKKLRYERNLARKMAEELRSQLLEITKPSPRASDYKHSYEIPSL